MKIVGMTWFLMALFMCQVMYLSLEEFSKKYGAPMWMLVFITAITGIGFNDKVWLPFSIQPAMGADFLSCRKAYAWEKKVLESR